MLAAGLRGLGENVTVAGVGTAAGCLELPALGRFHSTPIPARLGPMTDAIRFASVVHVIGYRDPVGTVAALTARRVGVPYFVEPAGMHRRRLRSERLKWLFDRALGERVLRGAGGIIATSELEAGELREDGIPRERIHIRPNGIDIEDLLPLPERGAMRRKLGIPNDARLVLSIGRITAKKGLLDLIRALARMNDMWAVIAGPDDGDGTLNRLLAERSRLGLGSRVTVLPEGLWARDKAHALADADVFCLPSASENFGNAVLEAAAVGVPVVVSSACGAVEWLDPATARIIPFGDVDALTVALDEITIDAAIRETAAAIAPRIRDRLNWKQIAVEQREIYRGAATTK
jgi:glycosyltransferase involved in cell wall biosynthesis